MLMRRVFLFMLCAAAGSLLPARAGFPGSSATHEAFLDALQERTFRWFWETTNPANGLTPDRTPDPPFSSIAAVGFALTAPDHP